ncbi:hypothetical protein QUF99_15035 [Bacillus sp. DX4.1]|uniref:hypothetical protein n=1 Tax=Bacillus sp. DX4.1 TaxID=3055867 RepID=UPI0025A0F146|nr:hypothetical protein [Bacillus sp. DX4.1]MDM5188582.1 hypothetical protein [Bacillus sp. DX4.1]
MKSDNTEEKVIRIPISRKQRRINERGEGYVECEVSNRWLQFHDIVEDLELIPVDVMTENIDGKERKLCELILKKEDILRALNLYK